MDAYTYEVAGYSSDDEVHHQSDNQDEFQALPNPHGYDSDDTDEEDVEATKAGKKKGTRAKKYNWAEKLLLAKLVGQVSDIIENVSSNNNIFAEKKKRAWEAITEHYAVLSPDYNITEERTEAQLRRCWARIKFKYRKEDSDAQFKKLMAKTGNLRIEKDDKMLSKALLYGEVRKAVPTIDFTLNNRFDSTGQVEGLQDSYIEEEHDLDTGCVSVARPGPSSEIHVPVEFTCSSKTSPTKEIGSRYKHPSSNTSMRVKIPPVPSEVQRDLVQRQVQKVLNNKANIQIMRESTTKSNKENNTARAERSPLKNVSNLKRTSTSQIAPDILGQRLDNIPDLQGSRTKKRKSASDVRIEFESRTKKQDAGDLLFEIRQIKIEAASRELGYWTNLEKASELEVQARETELHAKTWAVRVERMKYQYWQQKKLIELGSECPEDPSE
ncbi:hypothetical protein QAD02_001293 [Eretmocerus hayati]|uniref:Uncharacterized protein n=1 Tax=Eretmocerus hayati TaxID=131215 RepID=A0ACC2NG22_9HYME|nr:hypothetical protein QAD02_001293 [Eretmocerus hayati]